MKKLTELTRWRNEKTMRAVLPQISRTISKETDLQAAKGRSHTTQSNSVRQQTRHSEPPSWGLRRAASAMDQGSVWMPFSRESSFQGRRNNKAFAVFSKAKCICCHHEKNACKSLNKLQKTCTQNRSRFLILAIDQETLNMEDFIHECTQNIKHLLGSNTYEILYTENYNEQNQGAWNHEDVCPLCIKTRRCNGTKFWKNDQ